MATGPQDEEERRRLSQLYATMNEGELEDLAEEASLPTELAREVLSAEVERRGLNIKVVHRPMARNEVELRPLVTIRKFRDLPEALLAKTRLESAGIESFVTNENIVRLDWFLSNLVGGIDLQVKPKDVEAAQEILAQPIPEGFDIEGVGQYEQPRCPKCHSLDISFEEGTRASPTRPRGWESRCHCGVTRGNATHAARNGRKSNRVKPARFDSLSLGHDSDKSAKKTSRPRGGRGRRLSEKLSAITRWRCGDGDVCGACGDGADAWS
jgi:hypothetical protein